MLEHHRPLLAQLLLDYLYRNLLDAIALRSGADGGAYFTVNTSQAVAFAGDDVVLEGQGYFGEYIIWLKVVA